MQRMNAPSLPHHPRKLPKNKNLLIPKKRKKITRWNQATSVYNLVTKFVNKNAQNRTRESQILCARTRGRDGENAKRRERESSSRVQEWRARGHRLVAIPYPRSSPSNSQRIQAKLSKTHTHSPNIQRMDEWWVPNTQGMDECYYP
jgi:hypothetical protein